MPAAAMAASSRWRRATSRVVLSTIVSILAPRRLRRHVSFRNIIHDLAAVAQAWVAPAAAAGGAEDQAVARLHRHAFRLEELLFGAVAPHKNRLIDSARLAAVESPGRILGALAVHVGEGLAERPIGHVDAAPVGRAAGAAGVLAQREALDQEGILHFLQLDRRVAHIALTDRDRRGFAVFAGPPAPAAAEDVHQQKTPAVGAEARERAASHVAF